MPTPLRGGLHMRPQWQNGGVDCCAPRPKQVGVKRCLWFNIALLVIVLMLGRRRQKDDRGSDNGSQLAARSLLKPEGHLTVSQKNARPSQIR